MSLKQVQTFIPVIYGRIEHDLLALAILAVCSNTDSLTIFCFLSLRSCNAVSAMNLSIPLKEHAYTIYYMSDGMLTFMSRTNFMLSYTEN